MFLFWFVFLYLFSRVAVVVWVCASFPWPARKLGEMSDGAWIGAALREGDLDLFNSSAV